jgi:hypothetical protein
MTTSKVTTSIRFVNSNDSTVHLQVDPWAGFYTLRKGGQIEIIAESDSISPSFWIQEYGNTRILTLLHSTEYYVMRDGQRVHWSQYQHNYYD